MAHLFFADGVLRDVNKLPRSRSQRILFKLQWFARQPDPLAFAHPVHGLSPATHRFRIGDWRALFFLREGTIVIVHIAPRNHVYRKS